MDCKTARLLLDFARPLCPEMEPADAEALQGHLAECPECGPFAMQERRLDDHLGRAMRDVPVPADFKQRLLNRLSKQRDAWWRRWLVRGGAAAAAVLLAVAGTWYLWPLPSPNAEQVQAEQAEKPFADEEKVASYFRQQGFGHLSLPTQFDFKNLKDFYVQEFQGRRVPALVFEGKEDNGMGMPSTPVYAKVLVLQDRQFNLRDLRDYPRAESGMPKVQMFEQAGDPHLVFLVIYNANNLVVTFFRNGGFG
jgi:hypothetical protein